MNCSHRIGEDGDGPPCGDEGRLCLACEAELEREFNWLMHVSKYAAGAQLDDEYYAQLRDAGRL